MNFERSKADEKVGNSEEGRTIVHVRLAAPRIKFFSNDSEGSTKGVENSRNMNCTMYWNEDMERILYQEVERFQKNRGKLTENKIEEDQTEHQNTEINYESLLNKLNARIPDSSEKIDVLFLKQQVFYIMLGIMREEIERYNANIRAVKGAVKETNQGNIAKNTQTELEEQMGPLNADNMFKKTSFGGNRKKEENAAWDFQKLKELCQKVEDEHNGTGVITLLQKEGARENSGFLGDELRVFEEEYDGYDMINVEKQIIEPQKYLQSNRILNAKLPDLDEDEDDF